MHDDQLDRWIVLAAALVLLTLLVVGVLAVVATYSTPGQTPSGEWRPDAGKVGTLIELLRSLRSH
jgi:hypothetical protein